MSHDNTTPNEAFPTDPSDHLGSSDHLPLPAAPAVAVETDEFEAFGLWMNIQLSQLVARWKHLAAPAATAGASLEGRNKRKFGPPKKAK